MTASSSNAPTSSENSSPATAEEKAEAFDLAAEMLKQVAAEPDPQTTPL